MSGIWTMMSRIGIVICRIWTENISDVQIMASFHCPCSGHQLLMSGIWTENTVHNPDINVPIPDIIVHIPDITVLIPDINFMKNSRNMAIKNRPKFVMLTHFTSGIHGAPQHMIVAYQDVKISRVEMTST